MIRIYTCSKCHKESDHWGFMTHQTWHGSIGEPGEYVEIGDDYVMCPHCGAEIIIKWEKKK